MDAYTAVKNDEQVVLIYDPKNRQISIEDGAVISIDDAKTLFDRALVADCNDAMTTLCLNHYDMDAVQILYAGNDRQTPAAAIARCLRPEEERLNDIIGAAKDILAEQGSHQYNLYVEQQALDCVFQVLDNVRTNIYNDRDDLNDRVAIGS